MFTPLGFMEAREAHYQEHLGPLTQGVFHSTDVKDVHIDVYQFEPYSDRLHWTLITGGMSDACQKLPDGSTEGLAPRTEILLYAPKPQNWMVSVLKGLAEMPFDDDTYPHWWHTVQNGMPMTAERSLLTAFFFLPPYRETSGFNQFFLQGEKVDFLWLVPITETERVFAVEFGSEALEERIISCEFSELLDEQRPSIV